MTTFFGSSSGTVMSQRDVPTAGIVASPEIGVVGSVVRLDGSVSSDPHGHELLYTWTFVATPIGSRVISEGFRLLDESGSVVSFSPDLSGEYIVKLTVHNGLFEASTNQRISIRAILVPDGRGIVPDGKFIWSYIRDAWQQVEEREVFESLWSALIQITGSELLKLYEVDFNKSIRDIQEKAQKRWLCYEPRLDLEDASAFMGYELEGYDATTELLGQEGKAILLSPVDIKVVEGSVVSEAPSPLDITYSVGGTNVGSYPLLGASVDRSGYRLQSALPDFTADKVVDGLAFLFSFQSKTWAYATGQKAIDLAKQLSIYNTPLEQLLPTFIGGSGAFEDIRVGDIIQIPSGPNVGFYEVTNVTGSYVMVATAPPSSSPPPGAQVVDDLSTVYRPVGFRLPPLPLKVTSTFAVPYSDNTASLLDLAPGRIITVANRAYTVIRTTIDWNQAVPLIIISTDEGDVVPGRNGLPWRVPHTLVSKTQDFELLGVTTGDALVLEVVFGSRVYEVRAQVFGVSGKRLGFVLTTDTLTAGEGYVLDDDFYADLFDGLGIVSVDRWRDGPRFDYNAKILYDYLHSVQFQRTYGNKEITSETEIDTPVGSFTARAKYIIRNSLIPVDEKVVSIPVLQEWINQPQTTERDGKVYQLSGGQEFLLERKPSALIENSDFVIDGEIALEEFLTFRTGTAEFTVPNAGFVDKRIAPGDVLRIKSPAGIAGDYLISYVVSQDTLVLATELPDYLGINVVSTDVTILRRNDGTYIRLIPGAFTAAAPAPARLWAEVTYLDNSQAIENNFGILVGLTKKDLDSISGRASYRQAVAGLMYAYTKGPAIEKIRLGAQILLGLPFAEHRGIIRDINEDYRLDAQGNALLGRILVEDVDQDGVALGAQRVYTYPIDVSEDLAGIETNPATGETYKVDDIVEIFAPLAKGVRVTDYITDPLTLSGAKRLLQQFHSFRLKVNDNVFDMAEIELVSTFLRRITPSYVAFVLSNTSEFRDPVEIDDRIILRRKSAGEGLVDNISTGLSTPFMFDEIDFSGLRHIIDGADRSMFVGRRRKSGTDAQVQGGVVTFGGGLENSVDDGPPVRQGDILHLIGGPSPGYYPIGPVLGDTLLTLASGQPVDGTYRYEVIRPLTPLIASSVCEFVSTEAPPNPLPDGWKATSLIHVLSGGIVAQGVMYGDTIILISALGEFLRHTVVGVDVEAQHIRVVPEVPNGFQLQGYEVYREPLLGKVSTELEGSIVSNGTQYTLEARLRTLAEKGDSLVVDALGVELLVLEPSQSLIVPVLPAGTYDVRLRKRGSFSDENEFALSNSIVDVATAPDYLELVLTPNTTVQSAASSDELTIGAYQADLRVRPGDFIRFNTLNQVDHGFGTGIFLVTSIVDDATGVLELHAPMDDTGAAEWSFMRKPVLPRETQQPAAETQASINELIYYHVLNVGNVSRWGGVGFNRVVSAEIIAFNPSESWGVPVDGNAFPRTIVQAFAATFQIISDTEIRVTIPNPAPLFDNVFGIRLTLDDNSTIDTNKAGMVGPEGQAGHFRFPPPG